MIKPTVGRIVWFKESDAHKVIHHDKAQPLAAIVTYVHSDRMVNLFVFDAGGGVHIRTSVRLLQDGDKPEGDGHWAEWMPYQQGQAAKTEAAEKAAAGKKGK